MKADFIIECLDDFLLQLVEPTVVVLDNASLHTGQLFKAKTEGWEQKELYLFFLPKYSPHLNRIERLWKQVKYHWLKTADYLSLEALKEALLTIFTGFGTRFNLAFKELDANEKLILSFD